ncbi:MAG: hypothetical protein K6C98_04775 [Treponema sp.]|nr:hypothetical protein [Treponema sp.]
MTDEELDIFFIETLKKALADMKECRDYVKNLGTPEYKEICQDYADDIDLLSSILKTVQTIDDLAEMDEESITAVYDFIATYADNFLIHQDSPQKEADLAEYEKLEELLNLFMDTEDDDFEEDEE